MLTYEDILEWGWRRKQGGWCRALIEKLSLGKAAPRPTARTQPTASLQETETSVVLMTLITNHKPTALPLLAADSGPGQGTPLA